MNPLRHIGMDQVTTDPFEACGDKLSLDGCERILLSVPYIGKQKGRYFRTGENVLRDSGRIE